MNDTRRMVLAVFLLAALISLSCRLVGGSDAARSGDSRQTVPGSSGRPAKADGLAGAATRTLAPPAGSLAAAPSAFRTDYTPAPPILAPLAMMAPAEVSPEASATPTITEMVPEVLAPTQTPLPSATSAPVNPVPGVTQPPSPTATMDVTPTLTPTLGTPTATEAGAYPAASATTPPTEDPYPNTDITASPTLTPTVTLTPTATQSGQ